MPARLGIKHHMWKGEKAKHSAKHTWIRNSFGRAYKCENLDCKKESKKFDWANLSSNYFRDKSDYKMLCRKCHSIMDKSKYCKNGHKRTETNTKKEKSGYRRCLTCQSIERGWKIKW